MQAHTIDELTTHFAPAGRSTPEKLKNEQNLIQNQALLRTMLDSMPEIVMILNENRQVVAANQYLMNLLGVSEQDVMGKRPGEVINCENSRKGPGGCGTAPHCMTCGAVGAILQSQQNHKQASDECRIIILSGEAMDLEVTASALDIEENRYTVCAIRDISDQKRRKVLERTFFHDVINTAGGILGFTQLLADGNQIDSPLSEERRQLVTIANQLIGEIQAQRDLAYAESGDLELIIESANIFEFLDNLKTLYSRHQVGKDRNILLKDTCNARIETDCRLLNRVIGNMIKNALEATKPHGTVTISCEDAGQEVVFSIHNDVIMPEEVQLQIFQRSFSTKSDSGRGIGTHSMKLLGEKYLGGRVSFTSRESEGTVFLFALPKSPQKSRGGTP